MENMVVFNMAVAEVLGNAFKFSSKNQDRQY